MLGRVCSVLGALWLGGCAQLAGIDETSGGGSGGAGVTLTVERVSIGGTVVTGPQDLTGLTATWLLPDVSQPGGLLPITATVEPPNTWHADINPATPAVQFTLPDTPAPLARIYDLGQASLRASFPVLEHPGATPAPADATLAVDVTLDVPYNGEGLQLLAVGPWVVRSLPGPAVGTTALATGAFAYTSMNSQTGRPHEALTTADPVFVLRYLGNQLVGLLDVPPFDQTGADTITGALTTVPLDQSLSVTVDPTDVTRRMSAVRPAVMPPTMSWSLRAAPGHVYGIDAGPLLQAGTVQAAETTITATYGNPFTTRMWNTLLTWSTRATRTYTPPALALPVTLAAGMFQRSEPTPNLALTLPAGLPELIALDGMSLSTDGLTVARGMRPFEVTFVTDKPANTLYSIELYELVPNMANTALELKRIVTAFAPEAKFALPVELFTPGSHYTIRALGYQGGFPNVAQGDLATRSLPIAVSFVDSGVFQVLP